MSIASELSRIQSAKTALKTSINAKTDEQHQITNETIDDYSSFVDSITGGGGTGGVYEVNSVQEMEALTGVSENDYCVVKGSSFVNGYTQVEYIESSGTQYINTGVYPYKTKSEYKFALTSTSNSSTKRLLASYDNSTGTALRYFSAYIPKNESTFYSTNFDNSSFYSLGSLNTNIHTVIFNDESNRLYFDGTLKATDSKFNLSGQSPTPLTIFGILENNSINPTAYSSARMYYVKIWDKNNNNTLVRNFVPCYRKSDNEIGMYDIVNGVFYTNQGTGTFTKGADIENPLYTLYQYRNSTWVQVGEEYLYPTTTVTPTTTTQLVPIPTGYMGLKDVYVNGVEHTGAYKVDSVAEMNVITDMQNGDYCIIEASNNFWDKPIVQGYRGFGNGEFGSGTASWQLKYATNQELVSVIPGKTYVLSAKMSGANYVGDTDAGFFFFNNGTYISDTGGSASLTVTVPANANQISYNFHKTSTLNPSSITDVQLKLTTPYIVYQYNGTSWVQV